MPKITYEEPKQLNVNYPKKRSGGFWKIFLIVLISLLVGCIGGVGSIIVLSHDGGAIAKKLGFKNWDSYSIPLTETKKIKIEESSAIIDSVKKVSPAVVSVVSKSQVQNIFGDVYTQQGGGTGFIITSDGLILTNKHVVSDANATYTVILADGKNYDAKVQSLDPLDDIAVVKIDARNLPVVELGDSDQLTVGQWVVAVGNALGKYQNTVTVGVISAKERKVEASDPSGGDTESLQGLLQTDA